MWSALCVLGVAVSGVSANCGNNCLRCEISTIGGRKESASCTSCVPDYKSMGSSKHGDCCRKGCSACDDVLGSWGTYREHISYAYYNEYTIREYDGCNKGACTSGYASDSSGGCSPCVESCVTCTSTGPGKCDQGGCQRGFKNGGSDKCVACPDKCGKCDKAADGECDPGECNSGYGNVKDRQSGTTAACEPCKVPDCKKCPSAEAYTCELCDDSVNESIGVDPETGQCEECSERCFSCITTEANSCKSCIDGYWLAQAGVVGECIPKGVGWLGIAGVGAVMIPAILGGAYFFKKAQQQPRDATREMEMPSSAQ